MCERYRRALFDGGKEKWLEWEVWVGRLGYYKNRGEEKEVIGLLIWE